MLAAISKIDLIHFIYYVCVHIMQIETQSVQPWSNDLLEYEAKNFVYPPSFKLDVYSCAGNQTSSDKVTITFSSSEETTPGAFLHKIVVVLPGMISMLV